MKKSILFCLSFSFILFSTVTYSQNDRFTYAVTDLQQNGQGWNALRKLDMQTGQYSDVLLNGTVVNNTVYDAATKKQYQPVADEKYGNYTQAAFSTGVAAIAYDKKNNRIWYTPMFIDQLRYIDLKTMQVFYITDRSFSGLGNMQNDEGKIITRMVIAPDGNGYAISNDGNTFIKFSTNKKMKIENLGSLLDDGNNGEISIHSRETSFGGDMVADDDGHLYILSAKNNIFKIDISSKAAKHLGAVTGLPEDFSTNGLAVDETGSLLASSAVSGRAWYTIDTEQWQAIEYANTSNGVFRSSDLANSNYIATRKNNNNGNAEFGPQIILNNTVAVYPNPVTENRFTVQFNKLDKGNYVIQLHDISGREVQRKQISIGGNGQSETISVNKNIPKGVYMIKVNDGKRSTVFTQKLIIQ